MAYDDSYLDEKERRDNIRKYEEALSRGESIYMDSDDLTDIAEHYYTHGEQQKAIETIDYALRLFPHSADLLVFRARIALLDENDIERAKEIVNEVDDTSELEYQYLIAEIMIVEKKPEEADEYLLALLEAMSDDDRADYILDVATIFADFNLYDLAEKWLSLSDEKDLPDYQELKGRIETVKGNYSVGDDIFERLLDKNPYSNHLWNSLASSQMMQDRMSDAITSSEYSLAINPDDDEAIMNKANGLYYLMRFEEALDYYKRFSELRKNNYVGYMYQGNTLLNMGRPKEALEAYKKAEEYVPMDKDNIAELYQEMAFSLSALKRPDEAIAYLDRAECMKGGNSSEITVQKGYICLEQDDVQGAKKHFYDAITMSGYDPKVLLLIAISAYDCTYYHIASELFLSVIEANGDKEHDGYAYLAACYRYMGKDKEFRKYLKKACELNPKEARLVLGAMFPSDIEAKDYYKNISHML